MGHPILLWFGVLLPGFWLLYALTNRQPRSHLILVLIFQARLQCRKYFVMSGKAVSPSHHSPVPWIPRLYILTIRQPNLSEFSSIFSSQMSIKEVSLSCYGSNCINSMSLPWTIVYTLETQCSAYKFNFPMPEGSAWNIFTISAKQTYLRSIPLLLPGLWTI